jgi:ribosomal protein L37AE/L43A
VSKESYVVPDCRTRLARNTKLIDGQEYEQIYCGNCHKATVWVLTENCNFAFWLCDDCETKWMPVAGLYAMPDDEFFRRVAEAQFEKKSRAMTETEIVAELGNPDSTFSKLARDRRLELANRRG